MNPPKATFEPGPEYGPEARKYQGIPGIERAPGGRLWAVWYAGKVHEDRYNYVCCATSADDGRTWSDLKFVIDPDGDGPLRTSDPCLWLSPEGRLWLFWWMNGDGANQLNAMTADNPDDENPTWSEPRRICPGVMMCKPIVAADGTWLLPTAVWRGEGSCRVVASQDQGRTWELRGTATIPDPKDRNCDEPMLVQRRDGSLWMLVRTAYGIGETTSRNMGRTWTPVTPSAIPHPAARFFLRRLRSGNLLLVKHGTMEGKTGRTHLTAFLSVDDGTTWKGELLLDERATVSYPDGTQSPDGVVRLIYDWNRADDKHILMAAFTEADVLAGRDVSGRLRLRVLVNRATGINPKPWLKDGRFLKLNANRDGAALLPGPPAGIAPAKGEMHPVQIGAPIFADRTYVFHDPFPAALRDRQFLFGSIDGIEAVCTRPGAVYVLTPAAGRNRDSLEQTLEARGFVKAAVPEFVLFLMPNGAAIGGNVCAVYQRLVDAGEHLTFGKWGVLLADPAETPGRAGP
ncbi:MAG: exo-alpha-sialidase [Lentisphaeria bacterium]|nr:exo-alpha-sialidase [Lentisphaeria bacterium]